MGSTSEFGSIFKEQITLSKKSDFVDLMKRSDSHLYLINEKGLYKIPLPEVYYQVFTITPDIINTLSKYDQSQLMRAVNSKNFHGSGFEFMLKKKEYNSELIWEACKMYKGIPPAGDCFYRMNSHEVHMYKTTEEALENWCLYAKFDYYKRKNNESFEFAEKPWKQNQIKGG